MDTVVKTSWGNENKVSRGLLLVYIVKNKFSTAYFVVVVIVVVVVVVLVSIDQSKIGK